MGDGARLGSHPTPAWEERGPGLRVLSPPSELRGRPSCPARGSRLGLGLHVLHTSQDFLLVSRQGDSNTEKVPVEKADPAMRTQRKSEALPDRLR